ncbi:MAG TPA: ABC transporter ATP-binding protein [Pseudothermotoga sp.]
MKISCTNIYKTFSTKRVLEDISFESEENCIAILGANSAGKTTLLKIFATILKPDRGNIKIEQIDVVKSPERLRKILSFVPENPSLLKELNVVENIKHFAALKKMRVNPVQIMEKFYIPITKNPVRTLSKGVQQRLMIAIALMNNPKLLILDEPTSGLDRESKELLWKLLINMKNEGTTILLSTHDEEEVSVLADYLILLSEGRILLTGKVQDLPVGKFYAVQVLQEVSNSQNHVLSNLNGKTVLLVKDEELPKLITQHKVLNVKSIGLRELIELKNKRLL